MRWRIASLALGLLVALVVVGCIERVDQGKWGWGRILVLNAKQPRLVSQVGFQHDGKHWVITPSKPDHTLAAVLVTIRNEKSTLVSLMVDEKAAYLEDPRGNRWMPLDYTQARREVSEPVQPEGAYLPFLWGKLDIPQGYQVQGWMLFEVPQRADIHLFGWEQADPVRIRFKGP
ncbi:hypothetical protein HRbin23_00436 [bacterium HR23]|nr:hypothetical protein HRbin23_00436 [bacterium HR23]